MSENKTNDRRYRAAVTVVKRDRYQDDDYWDDVLTYCRNQADRDSVEKDRQADIDSVGQTRVRYTPHYDEPGPAKRAATKIRQRLHPSDEYMDTHIEVAELNWRPVDD